MGMKLMFVLCPQSQNLTVWSAHQEIEQLVFGDQSSKIQQKVEYILFLVLIYSEHSFEQRATFHDHKNYVIATCYIPPSDAFPDGLIATGSNDKTVCVYSPKQANHLFTLEGHEQTGTI